MKIDIITTPNEKLKETGFGGLKACQSIFEAIDIQDVTVSINSCTKESDLDLIIKKNPDLVILAVKYLELEDGEKIWLSEYFENQGVNFSGSSRKVLDFDSNKINAKDHLMKQGINTADYFTAIPDQFNCNNNPPIQFPLFLKPMDAANGNGVDDASFVENLLDFETKVKSLYEDYNLPILVEQYLDGREFTVAIIKSVEGEMIVSPIEIVPPESLNGIRILGGKVKKEDSEELKFIEDSVVKNKLKDFAINIFNKLGVKDFGRIDIKSIKNGSLFFLEANLVPGMTKGSSYFPRAFEIEHKFSYNKVVNMMFGRVLKG